MNLRNKLNTTIAKESCRNIDKEKRETCEDAMWSTIL